eukprot:3491048-Karenia_brevis.AAC.1
MKLGEIKERKFTDALYLTSLPNTVISWRAHIMANSRCSRKMRLNFFNHDSVVSQGHQLRPVQTAQWWPCHRHQMPVLQRMI